MPSDSSPDTPLSDLAWLFAHYRALMPERANHIAALPLERGDRVLDVGAGPGYFAPFIAERLGDSGFITCLEPHPQHIKNLKTLVSCTPYGDVIEIKSSKVEDFDPHFLYDVVLVSNVFTVHPNPSAALDRLFRLLRPSGRLILLEQDSGSLVLNPIPPELTARLLLARLETLRNGYTTEFNGFVGRRLYSSAEFAGIGTRYIIPKALHMEAPLTPSQRIFIETALRSVVDQAKPFADASDLASFEAYLEPESSQYVLDRPDFFFAETRFAFVFQLTN